MNHTREGPSDTSSILSRSRSRVKLPSLKRFASQEQHHNDKTPLLTIRLSSPSFLNTVVEDDTRLSLYTIKTAGCLTTVMRSDPWDGATKTADIRWPENAAALKGKGKKSGGVQVQMRGQRWVDEGSFLRAGSGSSSPRKFSIPNYSQSLKWRQIGTAYWCTSPSVKGPIAILEPAVGSLPLQLLVYETFRDKYDGRQMSDHQGVSILLLDYILITSLLLVTDVRELMQPGGEDQSDLTDTATETSVPFEKTGPCSTSRIPMTSMSQWRKIMYGEPIYPKRRARSDSSQSSPVDPTSHDDLANVMRGAPIYPNMSSTINFDSSSDSEPDNEISSSEPSPDLVPPTPPDGVMLRSGATASSSQVSLDQSLNSDRRYQGDDQVQHQPPPLAPIRPYQSHTPSPISAYPYESCSSSVSFVSRPRSTPPQGQDHQPPPLPSLSLLRNARSPSLPTTLLNRPTPARSRPLPRPPASSSAPTVRFARSQQGLSPTTPPDKYGSRSLPSPPSIRQQNIYPLDEAIDAGPAHLSQPLFHSSHPRYPQFTSPFQSSKTPAENDLPPWMRGRSGTVSSTADAPPYDVPPPAYDTINFDE